MSSAIPGVGRGTDARRRAAHGAASPLYAAIDLGSHNCRMLIVRAAARGFHVVDAFSRIVRLGEGLGANGVLSEAAMARTRAALTVCAGKIRRRRVRRIRGVATAACRRAANCDTFLAGIRAETGLALEIISSREEARLALDGCLPLLDAAARRALLFDIGGGSTELVWLGLNGGTPAATAMTSLACGVVDLAESFGGDRVSRATYDAMVAHVRDLLAPFDAAHGIAADVVAGGVQMLGTSGTVTTLAGVHLDLPRYDRARVDGLDVDFAEIHAVRERLLDLDFAGRAAIPSIGRERADLVIAGCAILDAIQRTWPVGRLRVADRGLREGMLMDMIRADAGTSVQPV